MIVYDYSKLAERIIERYGSPARFAEVIGMSERMMSLRLSNKVQFKASEIIRACEALNIPDREASSCFFTHTK